MRTGQRDSRRRRDRPAGTQQQFDFLDRLGYCFMRFARFELPLDLGEGGVRAVETPCQDSGDVERGGQVAGEQRSRVGDAEIRSLEGRTSAVWGLSNNTANSPNTAPGSEILAIGTLSLVTSTTPCCSTNSCPVVEPAASKVSPGWYVDTGKAARFF